jgi:preflagellin peptidase FlaK
VLEALQSSAFAFLTRGSAPDLLRLLAVPVFGWAAYRDIETRRVRNETWYPLIALGLLALAWDGLLLLDADAFTQRLFVVHLVVSLGLVAPLGYVFWRLGGFGGADAKAVMVLALLFPAYPVFYLPWDAWPMFRATLGVFSLTILSNTVLLGILYPVVLAAGNLLRGNVALAMFVGRPVRVQNITSEYGRLLETPAGFTRAGLDIDALRMYLRWRGTTLSALRGDPEHFRDPASLPHRGNDPGDGAIADGAPVADGGSVVAEATDGPVPAIRPVDDPWGAEQFLGEIEGTAYGTTPEVLRESLEVLVSQETVWITPGIPFIVPMFVGLVAALSVGDLLFALLLALGLV